MRRLAVRALIASAALVAMTAPFTGGSFFSNSASACSNPDCVVTTTTGGAIDTFVSPITITASSSTFAERATTAQTAAFSLTGTLGFTVLDPRGNNEGWVASVTSSGFSSSLFPLLPIGPGNIVVSGTPMNLLTCYGPYGCGMGVGIASSVGSNLGSPVPVAAECPAESIGEGQYAVVVPLTVNVSGLQAEKLGSYPASWFATFGISVDESPVQFGAGSPYAGYGCPAFSPAG